MSKLIYKRYEKFLRRYFECETHERLKIKNKFNEFWKFNHKMNEGLVHRFPRKEIKEFIKIECPVEIGKNISGFKFYEEQESLKKLRKQFDISEKRVCIDCKKYEECSVRNRVPEFGVSASLKDLMLVINAFVLQTEQAKNQLEDKLQKENLQEDIQIEQNEQKENQLRQCLAGFKLMDTLESIIEDLKENQAKESNPFLKIIKQKEISENILKNEQTTEKKQKRKNPEEFKRNIEQSGERRRSRSYNSVENLKKFQAQQTQSPNPKKKILKEKNKQNDIE